MVDVHPADSADPARWVLESGVDWQPLVRFGPPGFDAYVRIALSPPVPGGSSAWPEDVVVDPVRTALELLAAHTTTPAEGYAAVWEGWGGDPNPLAPRLEIPHRTMLLFTGPVRVLRDAPALAWYGDATGILQEPHLVWPDDHAWCLACEVDEEVEFAVGCSDEAAQALMTALLGGVRTAHYGEPAPLHSDES